MAVREKTPFTPNEIYYITFTVLGWRKIFTSDKYCDLVYKWFDYIAENYGNKIHGYVIMPNHIHALIAVTDKSKKLSTLIFNAKKFLAYEIVALLKKENKCELLNFFKINAEKPQAKHKVFKPRYDSLIIQTSKLLKEKLNYIHNNPCQEKWQLAEKPEEYKYSSAANYCFNRGTYDMDTSIL